MEYITKSQVIDLDLSGFITKSVNDLTNYYLKSETYTKAETENLVTDKLDTITQAEFDAIFNDW